LLPLQPFGLERRDGAATFAARRGLCPKAAPVCRTMSFDPTASDTYKAEEKLGFGVNFSWQIEFRLAVKVSTWA
jgi:hypothetical protein